MKFYKILSVCLVVGLLGFAGIVHADLNNGKPNTEIQQIYIEEESTVANLNIYYRDNDNDGYGDPNSPFETSSQPLGYVTDNTDCNDYDETIYPGATEIRGDGIDHDCDDSDLSNRYLLTQSEVTLLTQTQVSQLYVSIFGRASEGDGNTYWQTNESDMVIAADTMLATDSAKTYFGSTLDDNQMFIEFIYENTLGKTYAEDPDGINYWVGELAAGKSKGQVVAALINAAMDPEYSGLPAQDQFINKVEISNYTADTIATVPDVNDLTDFVNFISNVTDDSATVTIVKTAVDTFFLNMSEENLHFSNSVTANVDPDYTITNILIDGTLTLSQEAFSSNNLPLTYYWKAHYGYVRYPDGRLATSEFGEILSDNNTSTIEVDLLISYGQLADLYIYLIVSDTAGNSIDRWFLFENNLPSFVVNDPQYELSVFDELDVILYNGF